MTLCKKFFKKEDLSEPCFKLALIPKSAKLNYGTDKATGKPTIYPLTSVNNVFIFPGIPQLLERAFNNLGADLFSSEELKLHTAEAYFNKDELSLTGHLNKIVSNHPEVTFGSYPSLTSQYYKTRITVESVSKNSLEEALSELSTMENPVPSPDLQPEEDSLRKIHKLLESEEGTELGKAVESAIEIVEEAFKRYSPSQLSVCYNGGKDCIVMLHLVHAIHQSRFPGSKLKAFYVKEEETFPEVDSFMVNSVEKYNLALETLPGPMKPALASLLEKDKEMQAAFLGVRKGDPGWQYLKDFSPTDGDWPKVMRINPILSWSYSCVWSFIRQLQLSYPLLYDQGYTSLGSPSNTSPNPALAYTDSRTGKEAFRPAYLLEDDSLERKGRK